MNEASTDIMGQTVPYNADVEAGLLGAVLRDNEIKDDLGNITSEMFYVPAHRKLWEILTEQLQSGNPASPVTLKHRVNKIPELVSMGGAEYLARLTFEEFSIISPLRYAEIVLDLFQKREIIHICEETIQLAMDAETELEARQITHQAEQKLFSLEIDPTKSDTLSLLSASQSAIEEITKIFEGKQDAGVTSGFHILQHVMGGFRESDLVILAARPAMGKTALALNFALNAAKNFHKKELNKSVLFFSLEMSGHQLSSRLLSSEAGIKHEKLRLGKLVKEEYDQYRDTQKRIAPYPLYIEETPNINIAEMRAKIRRLSRKTPVGLVFLDYLQLLSSPNPRRNENRVQELSEITRGLKLLAREFNVPIIALSQLSRQVENRENKTPNLADLRESGSIEQDADMVLFIYRPEYYLKEPEMKESEASDMFEKRLENFRELKDKLRGIARIIIAKNRHGSPTSVELMFHDELITFKDKPDDRYSQMMPHEPAQPTGVS